MQSLQIMCPSRNYLQIKSLSRISNVLLSLDYILVEEPPDHVPVENKKLSLDSIPIETPSLDCVPAENIVIKGSTIHFKELQQNRCES